MSDVQQLQALPAFRYVVLLDGAEYTLEFRWNTRFQYWVINIYDSGLVPLYLGRKLLLGDTLFADVQITGMPGVDIVPFDTTGTVQRIARGDLGNAVTLYAI